MKLDADGYPLLEESARGLGVRKGNDITVCPEGYVYPNGVGMSVSPIPVENLPEHRRPPEYGGTGKDNVFLLDTIHLLDTKLIYIPDPSKDNHGFIAPKYKMTYTRYMNELASTKEFWKLLTGENKNDDANNE